MHRRPRLSPYGRQVLIERLQQGWSAAAVAEASCVSRATVYKWWRRFKAEGEAGLNDQTSRPRSSPRQLDGELEARVVELRQSRRLGPHRLAALTGVPRSTCYKILCRHRLQRLDWMDRPTGRLIRRYEASAPGELGHMDVKKLARIPEGGGHRIHGRANRPRPTSANAPQVGYEFVHSLLDDHSRVTFSEVLDDEKADTCGAFFERAVSWFAARGATSPKS